MQSRRHRWRRPTCPPSRVIPRQAPSSSSSSDSHAHLRINLTKNLRYIRLDNGRLNSLSISRPSHRTAVVNILLCPSRRLCNHDWQRRTCGSTPRYCAQTVRLPPHTSLLYSESQSLLQLDSEYQCCHVPDQSLTSTNRYGDRRNPLAGLPQNHEPVIESRYNASLLSITNPPVIPLAPLTSCPPESPPYSGPHETHAALLCTNKQIHEELASHFNIPTNRKTSLFISYPHGLHILATSTPQLLRQARSIHIAGAYAPRTFDPQRAARLGYSLNPSTQLNNEAKNYHGGVVPPHADQLGTLIASMFGPSPRHEVKKLELRIYYPGPDSYSTVWGDDNSPTVVALRNTYAGEVTIEVWRGRWGTGVYLYVIPNKEESNSEGSGRAGRGKRVVSTVWRRLEEGRRGRDELRELDYRSCVAGLERGRWRYSAR